MRTLCRVASATLLTLCATAHADAQRASTQRPTLVVMVTVDQMRPDYLTAWRDQFTGAYARILRDGAVFLNAFQDHANTETAPGHASILSGRFPYSTGIIANSRGVNTLDAPLLDAPDTGASPFRFRGTTLADWMKARDSSTRVLSVSRKDRAAILPVAPAHSHTVLWYSLRSGRFTTSTWYASALPPWVIAFNQRRIPWSYAGAAWNLLLPESAYPEADSTAAEPRNNERFPHVLTTDTVRLTTAIEYFPWTDSMTLALAWQGVHAMELGANTNRTDLLAISLSSTDAIGHRWGPDSRELHDQVLRADRYLGAFLDSLFALRGRERVIVALTADHGATPSPDTPSRFEANAGAVHVPTAQFRAALAAARATLRAAGADTLALRWEDLVLWLDRRKLGSTALDVPALARAFADSVRTLPGVLRADILTELARADTSADAIARRWLRMFIPGQDAFPGEVPLVATTLQPLSVLGRGDAGTHGTPHDYDARVPVAFLGGPFVSGLRMTKINVVDIAPTLAAALGIRPLERLDGRVLLEILR